jgi:pyruvate kinase
MSNVDKNDICDFDFSLSNYKRTKIVCTLGPATSSVEVIKQLICAGANVFRLNFSHGSHEEHSERLRLIRQAEKELGVHIAVLQDLCGPKIRITAIESGFVELLDRKTTILTAAKNKENTTSDRLYVEGLNPAQYARPGHTVYLSDGIIAISVLSVQGSEVVCEVVKGGRLRAKAGIAFPESQVDLPAATEKDLIDLKWGIENKVDYVAISFVRDESDILRLKQVINESKSDLRVIAKIERRSAIESIDAIIAACDGLMVARGDLGLEMPLEQIPLLQKLLISKCSLLGKPVIVATQMLSSMVQSIRPTRAEVSDIAAAVSAGTDAVMLSEETAIGEHPVACVQYLAKVAKTIEAAELEQADIKIKSLDKFSVSDAVAFAACAAAKKVKASAIVACTQSGLSARLVSKYRPAFPIFGASSDTRTLRRLALMWGIVPLVIQTRETRFEEIQESLAKLQIKVGFEPGERVVLIGGSKTNEAGSTSIMEIREL